MLLLAFHVQETHLLSFHFAKEQTFAYFNKSFHINIMSAVPMNTWLNHREWTHIDVIKEVY